MCVPEMEASLSGLLSLAWNISGQLRKTKKQELLCLVCDLYFLHAGSKTRRPAIEEIATECLLCTRVWVRNWLQMSALPQIQSVTLGKLLEPCKSVSHP